MGYLNVSSVKEDCSKDSVYRDTAMERFGQQNNETAPHRMPYSDIATHTNAVRLFSFQVSSVLSGDSMV
jgi:hypothetical protein